MCHWLFFLLRSSCEVDAAIIKENKLDLTTLAAIIKDKNLDLTLGSNVLFISPLSLLHNRLAILRISLDFLEFHPLWSRMISALLGAWIPSPPSFFFNLSSFLPLASCSPFLHHIHRWTCVFQKKINDNVSLTLLSAQVKLWGGRCHHQGEQVGPDDPRRHHQG